MKIKWLGHSTFILTSANGTKLMTDPYDAVFGLEYGKIDESADIVTVSHDHGDHSNVAAVTGKPEVIKNVAPREVRGIRIRGIETCHDDTGGSQRGANIVFCFEIDGLKVCHLGDLGHMLTGEQAVAIGKADILMIPVGGNFTIDAATADSVIEVLKPAVVIPMHYKNNRCPEFPVEGIESFTTGKTNLTIMSSSEVDYKIGELPAATQVVVLKPAR